jgi:hypothetical protein
MNKTGGEHLAGARQNLAFAQILRSQAHCGWAVTVLFYSAVHFTRAYLASCHGIRIVRHEDMNEAWKRYPDLAQIRSSYDLLKQQSHKHRYYLVRFDARTFDLLMGHIEKINSTLEPLVTRGNLHLPAKVQLVP